MDKYKIEAILQLEEEWAKELDLELIPQLPNRPRWAGRPECLDFYKFELEVEGLQTFDENL